MANGRRVVNAVIAPLWEHICHYADLQAAQNISLSVVVVYIAYRVNNPLCGPHPSCSNPTRNTPRMASRPALHKLSHNRMFIGTLKVSKANTNQTKTN